MRRKGNLIRRVLFQLLPFESYLKVLSKLYLVSFDLGLLRNNRLYEYPYFLKHIIGKGDVCIDIGANLGYITVILSRLVGKSGKVHAVEPVKPVLAVLKSNAKNLRNVEIYPFALGSENKSIKLVNNTKKQKGFIASGSFSVNQNHLNDDDDDEFEAEMKKGSELFSDLDRLDFIKIDVEGYETVVVTELEGLIKKFNPLLLIETRRQNRIDTINFFKKHNYQALVLQNGRLQPAKKEEFWDILFIPDIKLTKLSGFIDKDAAYANQAE